jgi:uncharacterized protein YcfL
MNDTIGARRACGARHRRETPLKHVRNFEKGIAMTRRLFSVCSLMLMLAGTALVVTGCAKPPGRATPDPISQAEYPQIVAAGWFDGKLSYSKPVVDGGSDYPLEVSVPIRLRASAAHDAQYRFVFFEADGRPVKPQMDWRYVKLPPRRQISLEGSATSTKAKDWRLEVRPFQ